MSYDESVRNALAGESLRQRIKQAVRDIEREFGVYVFTGHEKVGPRKVGDYKGEYFEVDMGLHVWPESMRIIEPERESKAIG